ncbi:hypothetical protein HG530_014381 [Fusarium avenaceum]|nr:hypothetical protein HG530_014381 [Fusarium avenaceum]
MRSSLFLTSTVLGLFPSCLEALAIRGQPNLRLGERGFVEAGNLTTRQVAEAPEECWVQGLGQSSYWFVPVYAGKEIYACVMAHARATGQSWNCPGEDWWPDSYVEEIITAGQEQITKDGGGETSQSGVFEARFEGTTTAVSDREGMSAVFDALFRYALPNCDTNPGHCKTKARHYYYRYKGDAIGIVHKQSDCRGFLGIGGDVYSYCPGRGHCQD